MIICGTGHRPDKLGGYSEQAMKRVTQVALNYLSDLEVMPTRIITGMALGWDTALAEAARDMLIPYVAAIPFKEQPYRWPTESQRRYTSLLQDADEVVYVCDPGYAAWKMQQRNKWMVDHADQVVALWNGTTGGTANCVGYAFQQDKPIWNVWDDYLKLLPN